MQLWNKRTKWKTNENKTTKIMQEVLREEYENTKSYFEYTTKCADPFYLSQEMYYKTEDDGRKK